MPPLLMQAPQVITNPAFVNVTAVDMQNQANAWFMWGPIAFLITLMIAAWSFSIVWQYVLWPMFAGPAVPPGSQGGGGSGRRGGSYLED